MKESCLKNYEDHLCYRGISHKLYMKEVDRVELSYERDQRISIDYEGEVKEISKTSASLSKEMVQKKQDYF